MTPDEFRSLALALPETEERSHMNHPDFRVRGKIFATLSEDSTKGMVTLTPGQQEEFKALDGAFYPASGKWGEGGATMVTLADADHASVKSALATAWENKANKS